MSKKRATLDTDGDALFNELCDATALTQLTMQGLVRIGFALYLVAFLLHVAYNVYEGRHASINHIERQHKMHGACIREEIIRTEKWEECRIAKIEKDMSVPWTTVNHVLHSTTPCIVAGCYSLLLDLVERLGWLFIGLACSMVVVFFLLARISASTRPSYTPGYLDDSQVTRFQLPLAQPLRLQEIKKE